LAAIAIAAAGIALAGVVALGARELPGRGTSRKMVAELGWDPRIIFVWLILTLFGLAAYVALTSEKGRMERSGKGRRRSSPMAIFIVLAILAVIVLLAGRIDGGRDEDIVPALPGEGSLATTPPEQLPGSAWSLVLVVLVLFCVLGSFIAISNARRTRDGSESVAGGVMGAVDIAIEELELGGEPSAVVIAAYRNMESGLARGGLGRYGHEAPREYVERALLALQVDGRSIARLTNLFEEARFSAHSINPTMAKDALAALRNIRSQLEPV
jgi:hypothetical protein